MVGKWLVEELLLQPYHQLLKKWLVDSRADLVRDDSYKDIDLVAMLHDLL
jgi:hypothetical protein